MLPYVVFFKHTCNLHCVKCLMGPTVFHFWFFYRRSGAYSKVRSHVNHYLLIGWPYKRSNESIDFTTVVPFLNRVATGQLDLNPLSFPDFFGALFSDFP